MNFRTKLFQRTYHAVPGHYQHMAEENLDPWKRFDAMWSAFFGSSFGNVGAYLAAQGDDGTFLNTWASGIFKYPDPGGAWNAIGPWSIEVHPTADDFTVGNKDAEAAAAAPFTNELASVTVSADILEVRSDRARPNALVQ